ncbi:hypothetical protein PFF91_06255 [Burkholderia cenocepacia]|uniref:hypothetical protein n=1 Tax=Burkholderia cenocepacia TaxID=95486 RepID=UPI001B9D6124|nr:hypothetical protein [Burkholderia cenocepacia]MBR8096724.1 hypothetical protein [Burkholderia cenocepacia]MDA3665595.1 hypothetical protein [Burkholderia cenocepacia]MDA3678021.1 hypothetical protein [Burkholderia cenocepacia]MDA3682655.1 hypothetical protein [Burkholderia cenocepacia]MDA3690588.1 hypothetical protein [Burkholderia cenocepacia]
MMVRGFEPLDFLRYEIDESDPLKLILVALERGWIGVKLKAPPGYEAHGDFSVFSIKRAADWARSFPQLHYFTEKMIAEGAREMGFATFKRAGMTHAGIDERRYALLRETIRGADRPFRIVDERQREIAFDRMVNLIRNGDFGVNMDKAVTALERAKRK